MGADTPEADRAVGMLIVRVWREGSAAEPALRARLNGRRRIADEERELAVVAEIDDVVAHVRSWLEDFLRE